MKRTGNHYFNTPSNRSRIRKELPIIIQYDIRAQAQARAFHSSMHYTIRELHYRREYGKRHENNIPFRYSIGKDLAKNRYLWLHPCAPGRIVAGPCADIQSTMSLSPWFSRCSSIIQAQPHHGKQNICGIRCFCDENHLTPCRFLWYNGPNVFGAPGSRQAHSTSIPVPFEWFNYIHSTQDGNGSPKKDSWMERKPIKIYTIPHRMAIWTIVFTIFNGILK